MNLPIVSSAQNSEVDHMHPHSNYLWERCIEIQPENKLRHKINHNARSTLPRHQTTFSNQFINYSFEPTSLVAFKISCPTMRTLSLPVTKRLSMSTCKQSSTPYQQTKYKSAKLYTMSIKHLQVIMRYT